MEFVDRLVLVCPLQVQLDLSDQWEAVGVCYVQFLHFIYSILLQTHTLFKHKLHLSAAELKFTTVHHPSGLTESQ